MIRIQLDVSRALDVLEDFDALEDGSAYAFVTEDIARLSDPYVPMQTGILKNSVHVTPKHIEYNAPYAAFVYMGKVMLGEQTHSPFARKNERKYVTDKDLTYRGAPKRGAHWVERMWAEKQDAVLDDLVEFLKLKGY